MLLTEPLGGLPSLPRVPDRALIPLHGQWRAVCAVQLLWKQLSMESSAPGLHGELSMKSSAWRALPQSCVESSAPGLKRHNSAQALPGVLFSPALPSGHPGPRNPQLPVPCRIHSFLCWNGKQSSRICWCPCPLLMGWPGHVTPPLSALVMLKCRIYLLH